MNAAEKLDKSKKIDQDLILFREEQRQERIAENYANGLGATALLSLTGVGIYFLNKGFYSSDKSTAIDIAQENITFLNSEKINRETDTVPYIDNLTLDEFTLNGQTVYLTVASDQKQTTYTELIAEQENIIEEYNESSFSVNSLGYSIIMGLCCAGLVYVTRRENTWFSKNVDSICERFGNFMYNTFHAPKKDKNLIP